MQKPETKFRAKVRPKLESIPGSFWESIQQKAIKGTPDIIGCINGTFVAIELKTNEGVVSKIQDHKLSKIREAHGIAIVLYPRNFDEVFEELLKLSKCNCEEC